MGAVTASDFPLRHVGSWRCGHQLEVARLLPQLPSYHLPQGRGAGLQAHALSQSHFRGIYRSTCLVTVQEGWAQGLLRQLLSPPAALGTGGTCTRHHSPPYPQWSWSWQPSDCLLGRRPGSCVCTLGSWPAPFLHHVRAWETPRARMDRYTQESEQIPHCGVAQ